MKPTAESRSCRSQVRCTGVCPEGAQVRRRTGWSMKPLSSKKTMGLPRLAAPFLSAASPAFAIQPRRYRLLPWHVVRASGMSSPSRGVSSQHDPGDTSREIAWPQLRPRDRRSTGRFGIQLSLARPRESSTVVASASRSDGACDQDVVWQLTPRGLLFSTARRHRRTDDCEAPTISATSSTSLSSNNNCPANIRRACSSAALPFGLIPVDTHVCQTLFIGYAGLNRTSLALAVLIDQALKPLVEAVLALRVAATRAAAHKPPGPITGGSRIGA